MNTIIAIVMAVLAAVVLSRAFQSLQIYLYNRRYQTPDQESDVLLGFLVDVQVSGVGRRDATIIVPDDAAKKYLNFQDVRVEEEIGRQLSAKLRSHLPVAWWKRLAVKPKTVQIIKCKNAQLL